MALKEFENADELMAFYRDLRVRTNAWGPRPSPPPPVPAPLAPDPEPHLPPPMTPLHRILVATAQEFDISADVIRSGSRVASVVVARGVVCRLARELTSMSTNQIGKMLGGRDHSTVMHAVGSIARKLSIDPVLALKVQRLRDKLLEHERDDDPLKEGEAQ